MLRRLFIRDYAIVDQLDLEFPTGFGALTGETGAGKSIMVDALSLVLGERVDNVAVVIRAGQPRAEIVAEFDAPTGSAIATWLASNDLDNGDAICLLRRIIDAGGRSRATINGSPATLIQCREVAELLADIHGQNAHHSLLRTDAQRQLFDQHAGLSALTLDISRKFQNWKMLHEARERAEQDIAASAAERDLIEWQWKELQALDFDPIRWQEDHQEQRRLAHAAHLSEGLTDVMIALDQGDVTVTSQLDKALSRLTGLLDFDSSLAESASLLDNARIQLLEGVHALSRYRDRLDPEPGRLAELEGRMGAVTVCARKHRVSPEELPDVMMRFAARLETLRLSADPVLLTEHEALARKEFEAVGGQLTVLRQQAAVELSQAVTEAMQQLAMPGACFEVVLAQVPEGTSHGFENVEFHVTANVGQPLRALAKVASGGELSRIGLCLQVIASSTHDAPTLIFDEVDVGIGGRVAEVVGQLLRKLGKGHQVLCVTHLPQVAAQANWQWSVSKETRGTETVSHVTPLDAEGRVDEIARMLGGVRITETTRQHAREMLKGSDIVPES